MYIQPNIEARSCNQCYRGITISILKCVCSLSYPASNAHAPYCHLCPVRLYHIFPHYLIKQQDFRTKVIAQKSVFWFCLQLLSETFLILRRTGPRYYHNYACLHVTYQLFFSDFNATWIFLTIFEKSSNIKFHENMSSGSRIFPCGRTDVRTDGQTDMTMLIAAFRNFAKAPKNKIYQSLILPSIIEVHQWRTERGGLGCSNPPPQNSEGPPKLCQTQPDLWKLLKIAEFRTPTPPRCSEKRQ